MRKLALGLVVLIALAVAADFGAAAYTEYRVSRAMQQSGDLGSGPEVTISGFPFLTQLAGGDFHKVTVTADDVPTQPLGKVDIKAVLQGVHVDGSKLMSAPTEPVRVNRLDGQMIIEQTTLGRYLGIPDLEVSAPTSDNGGGSEGADGIGLTEAGQQVVGHGGVVLTGTVDLADRPTKVSVQANLVRKGSTVSIVAHRVFSGSLTKSGGEIPEADDAEILDSFSKTLDPHDLPFGITPTAVRAKGSKVIIEGQAQNVDLTISDLRTAG